MKLIVARWLNRHSAFANVLGFFLLLIGIPAFHIAQIYDKAMLA